MNFLWLLPFMLLGCQQGSDSGPWLHFRFPEGLRSPQGRWEHFLSRALTLEVVLEGPGGTGPRMVLGPPWEGTRMPSPPGEWREVRARLWDRDRQGLPRAMPVAEGRARWQPSGEILVPLRLQVSVKEYDP